MFIVTVSKFVGGHQASSAATTWSSITRLVRITQSRVELKYRAIPLGDNLNKINRILIFLEAISLFFSLPMTTDIRPTSVSVESQGVKLNKLPFACLTTFCITWLLTTLVLKSLRMNDKTKDSAWRKSVGSLTLIDYQYVMCLWGRSVNASQTQSRVHSLWYSALKSALSR